MNRGANGAAAGINRRLGLAYPGDVRRPNTWSGTPSGIYGALQELGFDVEPLAADLPPSMSFIPVNTLALARYHRTGGRTVRERLQTSRATAMYTGRQMPALRTLALRQRLKRVQPLDAIVQIQTGYHVPSGYRVATFEDMTATQALTFPYPEWQSLSPREKTARLDGQRRAYEEAAACCFTTRWAADSAVTDYGIPREKVHAVGVGHNHVTRIVDRDWDVPRFLWVGAEWERKNGERVVRAFSRVRQSIPEAHLDLVGDHPRVDVDGVTGHGWLSLADDAQRRKLDALFERATCFVMPSLYEPSAIVYVEAGAAGIPSIGTTVGGSAELIGLGGLVIDPVDEAALVRAMIDLADPGEASRVGAVARDHSRQFTWRTVATKIVAALGIEP